ncbi:AsmA-like C-terminal region-containing protein [Terrimonas alba]|uniref:AsmA-like C-terminal region-containing protein n=1 Tax=Terrimonas alba TaxID=3349636 RepID=UPI0035F38128
MNKGIKKALKITGIIVVVLVALAFIIPIAFKKQITDLVKKEINKSLTAKVDFADVSLSLFRHFPKVSISLDDLSVVGTDEFVNDTLIATKNLDASVNLISVIKGKDIKVSGVYLESPRIHALVNKDGKANWDITKADSAASVSSDTATSAFKMTLQKYAIKDGYIYYKDESSDMSAEISGLDHEGSGDFTQDEFILSTVTKTNAASFTYAAIPYLSNTKTSIGADIKIDNKTNTYTFRTDDIALNNLKVSADGSFQLVNDSTYNMDIKFKSPSNEFKDILSLIPAVYKNDFATIKTSGSALFNGWVKGIYSPTQMPAYDVNLEVKDGFFQYPDLPKPVKNIQVAMHLSNPDGKMDNTVVDISKGHLEMDNEPFDFKLLFKNPETSQYVDAVAKGKLDLANLSKFVKLEGNTKLAGLVLADIFAKGNLSAIQTQQGPFTAGGFLDIKNLFYSSSDFPQPIQNGNMKVQLQNSGGIADNTTVDISAGHIEVGKDPFDFSLQLRNPVSSVDFSGAAKGRFTLDNVKQFTTLEPGTAVSGILNADLGFSGNKTAIDKSEYDKININGTAGLSNLKYASKDYPTGVTINNTQLTFNQKNITLNNLRGNYLNTNFTASGVLNNLIGYAMKDQTLSGNLDVTADKLNLNDWMGTEPAPATETPATSTTAEPFLVPAGINFTINAKAGEVKYDKVNYNNINGTVVLNDQTVKLQNVKTDALDGSVAFNGSYSTKTNKKQPDIAISYDVKDVDVQKAFFAYNTFQKLMPIGQFLSGKLSSQLSMTGNLNGDMMPDLSSLTGQGNLLLLEGVLKKFAPLEKLANTLQIDDLKSIAIKDIKNYIEFANGKVLVKPFTVKVKDIDLQIGGMHGFDQSIDYVVAMKVPRKYLGTQGNNLVNGLATQASSKGIPVTLGDVVNLNIKMGGSLTNPSIKTDLKEVAGDAVADLKQQAADFAQAKADSAKQRVRDSVNVVKNQVVNDVKEDLKNKILGNKDSVQTNNTDSTKKKAEQTIKNTINDLFKKKKKVAADTTAKQ